MKNFKGTKGKWLVFETPDYHEPKCSRVEIGSDENTTAWICKVQNNGLIEKEEGNANALLISKAPELLETLLNLHQAISSGNAHLLSEWNLKAKTLTHEILKP